MTNNTMTSLIIVCFQSMKQESNDVKALGALLVTHVAKAAATGALDVTSRKALVPMLVNGSKERNTLVKTNSEQALVSLLGMRDGDDVLQVRALPHHHVTTSIFSRNVCDFVHDLIMFLCCVGDTEKPRGGHDRSSQ